MISESQILNRNHSHNLSNSSDYNGTPRFRWYHYKEGFSRQLVEEAISSVNITEDDYILDPFNGNGTVTITASINNIKSYGIEVNPFVAFMSKVKLSKLTAKSFNTDIKSILSLAEKSATSELLKFSTFSEFTGKDKWLFNSSVLNSFEGGWAAASLLSKEKGGLFQLALIGAALDNCNAVKDGKCLKYRNNWQNRQFDKWSFINSLENRLQIMHSDLSESCIAQKASILNADSRTAIDKISHKFKLCITSPPYLNSFDYTDIYRPELFLGKFISNNKELHNLRYRTVRSHVEIILTKPISNSFGEIYRKTHEDIAKSSYFWDKQIPVMIQSYFEDMQSVLLSLKKKAKQNAELWIVVGNSIYSGIEIPVDLILAEIGTRIGWKLHKIEVLRNIQRRQTKYNGELKAVRESLIVLRNN